MAFLVFDTRGSDLYAEGLPLAEQLPFIPYQLLRSSGTVATLAPPEVYTAWVAHVDTVKHPRASHRQADLRALRLMEQGADPSVLYFLSPAPLAGQMALQFSSSWRVNAL